MTTTQIPPRGRSDMLVDDSSSRPDDRGRDSILDPSDSFIHRHIGPDEAEVRDMLALLGAGSLDELIDQTVPESIRRRQPLRLPEPRGEFQTLSDLRRLAEKNKVFRSFLGMGYYDTITPPVIQRNILENPGWYTQYTPYQAEIAQGRLEALINFQTMVADLTGLPLAGASLLDEATAAAEAMAMCSSIAGGREGDKKQFIVAGDCHPQTIAVVQTRGRSMGVEIVVGNVFELTGAAGGLQSTCGVLVQYPTTDGRIVDYSGVIAKAHAGGALVVYATDLLACTLIKPPGEWGADIAVGSSQRFGVPMGFGGPHAAFLATKTEFARKMPGRLIGVSKDVHGNVAYRMAIQTREQHIKRDRATSNICTAQVLLAIMAGMYAVYHGPEGLKRIAQRVHAMATALKLAIDALDSEAICKYPFFDTICVRPQPRLGSAAEISFKLRNKGVNSRLLDGETISFSCDETTTFEDLERIVSVFNFGGSGSVVWENLLADRDFGFVPTAARTSSFLTHPVFNTHHSETEMLRYIRKLESRDLSLTHSMIPLGSCTMKLNGTTEMFPVSWPQFSRMHPFAPPDQWTGYAELFATLEAWLAEITGFAAVSLQPNAGSQGEYAGLLAIRAYHESRGQGQRDVCLIPVSAHGTNPASAVVAGMKVVAVECDERGNVDLTDLASKAAEHRDRLAAIMITYPSTHGVFEVGIREICKIVHDHGGQVYMDGANMNAQVGLTRPGDIGADVCHLNLHKTFCIPHGGGGPGMGPIAVAAHLAPFLPQHPLSLEGEGRGVGESSANAKRSSNLPTVGPVAAAPYGSAGILPIPYVYIALMGGRGLTRATQVAILNANYMALRLAAHFKILFSGAGGRVAHEFIVDCREFDGSAGVKVDDIAKRLMDYGFHAPTMSFPVPGTLMIEPTESECRAELDRFCDALIAIRREIHDIEQGRADRNDNVLKSAPHTAAAIASDEWTHPYSRQQAAFPAPWLKDHKFWPAVGRIDNPYGDRNLFCTCPPVQD